MSIWTEWLEDNPSILYGSSVPQGTPAFTDYWRSQFGDVYNQYESELGRMAKQGLPPSLKFSDYLGNYSFSDFWNMLSPRQQGQNMSLNPSYLWRY